MGAEEAFFLVPAQSGSAVVAADLRARARNGLRRCRFGPRELPAAEMVKDLSENRLIRAAFGQREPDPADRDPHDGPDLEQLQADRIAASLGQRSVLQPVLPQSLDQNISRTRQPQPQLIGPHGLATGAIGEQAELLLLDAVLQVAPSAVAVFVQRLSWQAFGRERRNDEPGIRTLGQMLGLADDAALAAPAFVRAIGEVFERAGRLARGLKLLLHLMQAKSRCSPQKMYSGK